MSLYPVMVFSALNKLIRSPLLWIALLVAWVALTRGQDHNWDLLNYHAYNPFAWLHGRHAIDLMPAQMQSWYNPTLDLPFYWLATAPIDGRWVALWLALPAVFAVWVGLRLATRLAARPLRLVEQVLLVLVMLSGGAGFASLATTFNEWPIALGLISCLYLLMRGIETSTVRWWPLLLAGLIGGAAVGLKLTAMVYALALGIGCLCFAPTGARLRATAGFGLAGLLGALLAGGVWFFHVYTITGNPVFPYFNDLFNSPFAEPWRYQDDRFKPQGLLETFRHLGLLARGATVFGELRVRDPRLLLGLLGFVIMAIAWLRGRLRWERLADRQLILLWSIFVVGLIGWLWLHAIYRYTIFLELLVAVGGIALITRVDRAWLRWLLLGLVFLAAAYTQRPDWGRQDYSKPFLRNTYPDLPADSVIVTLSWEPLGYAVVGLPKDVPVFAVSSNFIRPDRCLPWHRDALEKLGQAQVIWLLQAAQQPTEQELQDADRYGLQITDQCRSLRSTLGDKQICRMQVQSPDRLSCKAKVGE